MSYRDYVDTINGNSEHQGYMTSTKSDDKEIVKWASKVHITLAKNGMPNTTVWGNWSRCNRPARLSPAWEKAARTRGISLRPRTTSWIGRIVDRSVAEGEYNTCLSIQHKDVPVCLMRGALMIELYQFYFSHYCEKARWALDYKGMSFKARNLRPGLHRKVTSKLAPKTCMPIIVDGEKVVQDSTAIINYLDEKYPNRLLTPRDPSHAKAALEWEEYLDEEIGVTLRLWFYYHALPNRDRALRFILEGGPWYGRPLFVLIFPKVRERMMALMNINTVSAGQAEDRLLAALKKLDDALEGRRFLAGDGFSRADLTACALLSPYVRPGESDAQAAAALPDYVRALRDQHKIRCYFGWVREMYRDYRPLSSASPRLAA